jgi:hypothetical protein
VDLIKSVEDFRRKEEEGILPLAYLWALAAIPALPWVSRLLVCPADFRFT